ncbi:hypothetical protein [Streptomonospora nanhaiensis]|uniref:Uncharacterized protein n=1 Tax=Streptomonospora nanhaiensis TaxID=1323731 RepID=A0A853BWU7_9ACTN|nr:hypothetical protein [Streptomonospora nanhaiensis]MBV2367121.1 hypothetical protein [Streptomonospora nanhaiensis]NYI99286.1 hypothetical protein [Streptomonospora nanhaiensis]
MEAYLTQDQVDWLWQVRAAAVARRLEHVQSAVVRLALDELAARMSPEEVAEALAAQERPATGQARGRRR